jgi:hypothetical protein
MAFVVRLLEEGHVSRDGADFLTASCIQDYAGLLDVVDTFPELAKDYIDVSILSGLALQNLSLGVSKTYKSKAKQPRPARAHGARDPSKPRTPYRVPGVAKAGAASRRGKIDLSGLPAVDNRGQCGAWPVLQQGDRGTCVAFAVVASLEHHHGPHGGPLDLAEQYLYWAAKQSPLDPDPTEDGTTLACAREALGANGVCAETLWTYNPTYDPNDLTHSAGGQHPQTPARNDAMTRVRNMTTYRSSLRGRARELYDVLAAGQLAAVTLPVFAEKRGSRRHNWNALGAETEGRVLDPAPGALAIDGHAVCMVGFAPDASDPDANGGGRFLFRNSWGTSWATNGSVVTGGAAGIGYGSVSAVYVNSHGWEMLAL